ncbi:MULTISPECIES: HAMP domain-containing protein [unclassified Streptomyces]|uniref:HAMP domain-containing protein n=1 Tax=unclassified Streptomyces TaxID=2593676 RepID=UPI003826CE04
MSRRGVGPDTAGSRRARRLASSVWLPWAAGVLALLTIAGAALAVGGRVQGGVTVPAAVLDSQQQVTVGAAQHVRRAIRAGELDLSQLAAGLSLATDTARFDGQLKDFRKRYGRYRAVYVLDADRRVVAQVGGRPHPERVPDRPVRAGSTDALAVDRLPVVVQHAPFTYGNGSRAIAVAEFDLTNLKHAFDAVLPATAWVVDAKGEVIASTAGFTVFQKLERAELRSAAGSDRPAVSLAGGGSVDAREIVAAAPVRDGGKTPGPSWRVVTARSVNTVLLPETQARDQAKLAALAVAVVAVAVFGWLYVMWLRPLRRLVGDAERIADGELRTGVEVRRHDELGQVARSLERIRLGLAGADSDRTLVR